MDHRFFSVVICVFALSLLAAPALAKKGNDAIPGGELAEIGGSWVGTSWDCSDHLVDGRNKKGEGNVFCLRTLAMDSATGESVVGIDVLLDRKKPVDLDDARFHLTLREGKQVRVLRTFELSGDEDTGSKLAELVGAPKGGMTRAATTVLFSYQSWNPGEGIRQLKLALRKVGGGEAVKWEPEQPLVWTGDFTPPVMDGIPTGPSSCTLADIKKTRAGRMGDLISSNFLAESADGAFSLRFDLPAGEGAEHELYFPDHGFYIRVGDGDLRVRGSETLDVPLRDIWREEGDDNTVQAAYDGESLMVDVNGTAFGPLYVRQRDGRSTFRWEIELEGNGARIRNLALTPCNPFDDPTAKPEAEAEAEDDEAVADAAPRAERDDDDDGDDGAAPRVRKKRKAPNPAKVMQAVHGLAAAGNMLNEAGGVMQGNIEAAREGRVDDLQSYRGSVTMGEDGSVTTTRATGTITDGGMGVEAEGQSTTVRYPDMPAPPLPGASQWAPLTIHKHKKFKGEVLVGGAPLELKNGRNELEVESGRHRVEVRDASGRTTAAGTVDAVGDTLVLHVDPDGRVRVEAGTWNPE